MCPENPEFTIVEAESVDELMKLIEEQEHNLYNVTAVPVTSVLQALGIVEPDETITVTNP